MRTVCSMLLSSQCMADMSLIQRLKENEVFMTNIYVQNFDELTAEDTGKVGGKNASLGEMIRNLKIEGIRVPGGFATTTAAYREFITANEIEKEIAGHLKKMRKGDQSLDKTGKAIRRLFHQGSFPSDVARAIGEAYEKLSRRLGDSANGDNSDISVAVRSSATAEDLPEASFAGQQETFLNVTGEKELLGACRSCFASLYTDRAISYREEKNFPHDKVALSAGVQQMVRSDKAGSGVMFSLDTETGFPHVVVIDAVWGLGENVVQGTVNPDEYKVFKPLLDKDGVVPIIERRLGDKEKTMVYAKGGSATVKNKKTPKKKRNKLVLSDEEILQLARWAVIIENHYGKPMDMEWAKDGDTNELYIVQARPETVQSQKGQGSFKRYALREKSDVLVRGLAVGDSIACGRVAVLQDHADMDDFEDGSVLVTEMTDPDWGPIMKRASAIVTEHGGRTSHAAIVSRELGIPAVVGAGDAMQALGIKEVTVSCAEGETGIHLRGRLDFDVKEIHLEEIAKTSTSFMLNIASPDAAMRWWRLPVDGIGLARMEFIINNSIKIHPLALLNPDKVDDTSMRKKIDALTGEYEDLSEYFVDRLALGIASIAASQYPRDVIVRMSDFKSNEYANLIGGSILNPTRKTPCWASVAPPVTTADISARL